MRASRIQTKAQTPDRPLLRCGRGCANSNRRLSGLAKTSVSTKVSPPPTNMLPTHSIPWTPTFEALKRVYLHHWNHSVLKSSPCVWSTKLLSYTFLRKSLIIITQAGSVPAHRHPADATAASLRRQAARLTVPNRTVPDTSDAA